MFSREGRANHYEFRGKKKENAQTTQLKGRGTPILLQNDVDAELQKLLKDRHIVKVEKNQDDVFIQLTVITVIKDKSVKIALDARALNESIAKDKYRMPILDNLFTMIAEKLDEKEGQA